MRPALQLSYLTLIGISLAGLALPGCEAPAEAPLSEGTFTTDFPTDFPAPTGRALELEDYYEVRALRAAVVSPDGGWVAYAVSLPDEESDGDVDHQVWLVPTDASTEARRVLHEGGDVSAPSWLPSGRLGYGHWSGRWSIDPANAPASPRRERTEPENENWSPDRFWLASFEEAEGDEEESQAFSDFEARHEERFEGVQFDWLNFQRDGQPIPTPDPTALPAREIKVTPIEGGASLDGGETAEEAILTDLGLLPSSPVWHPNSVAMAFTADSDWTDETRYGNADVWLVTVEGDIRRVTEDGWNYGSVGFSPDGRYLSFTGGYGTDMIKEGKLDHGGPRDLFVVALDDGMPPAGEGLPAVQNLTASWDLDAGRPIWSPDGETIFFTAEKAGGTHLFRVPVASGPVEQITQGERSHNGLQISDDFTTIVYTLGLFETPADLYAADIDGSNERRLTNIHTDLKNEITLSRAERLLYASYDGTPVEGWLLYPYGYDPEQGPYPMIVHSHGGPHAASGYGFSFKHQFFAANGYFVLSTNFRSSTGYGEDFKWATWGAWGDKDGEDVMAGIDYAIANFAIDPERVASIGHSYGGFMTNWLIARYPDRFAAAAAGAGIVNWVSDYGTADIARTKETEFFGTPWETEPMNRMIRQSPLTYAGAVETPTLFIHGAEDQRVPYSEAEQMFVALKKNGVPAKVIRYDGMAHGIRGHWNNVHRMMHELRWFDEWMEPGG